MHELLAILCEALEQEKREGFNNFAQSGAVVTGPSTNRTRMCCLTR